MRYQHKMMGTCARMVEFDIEDGIIRRVSFTQGCGGNTQGIAALCEGRPAAEVAEALSEIGCGMRGTSCPAELAKGIKKAMEGM